MSTTATRDTIAQLNHARSLCFADPNNLYPQIVPGIAGIIHANAELELRRWGSEFLCETFASPVLSSEHKQKLSVQVLDQLLGWLERKDEDTAVLKSVVQTAASLYPFVFRFIIANPQDVGTWQKMASIKSNILRRMDNAPPGVQLSCVKFIQSVIQVQTPGMISDPRRPEHNETSLALVPRDHPVIPPSNLEAEASGLLDRLLDALQVQSGDALLVTSTLNALGALVRRRASIANKIIAAILNFDPFVLVTPSMTVKDKIMAKSMCRTIMAFLLNIIRRTPSHPMAGRIQGRVDRLRQLLVEVFEDISRKRTAPAEPTDGLSDAKRRRLGAEVPEQTSSDMITYAQLFTLTQDPSLQNFDVKTLPLDLVLRLVPPLLTSIDKTKFDTAINAVRTRYLEYHGRPPITPVEAATLATSNPPLDVDDEEDYVPDFIAPDKDEVMNELANNGDGGRPSEALPTELVPLELPPPPPLSEDDTRQCSKNVVGRVFSVLQTLDSAPAKRTQKLGLNRLAGANRDRDAWLTLLSRLATRTSAGLDADETHDQETTVALKRSGPSPGDSIREALLLYTIDDFRRRIDIAIAWLNEEWYNDQIAKKQAQVDGRVVDGDSALVQHYEKWLYKVLDGMLPFLDAKDKLLIRFLSEIPAVDGEVIRRVTRLAADPERVGLVVMSIHYLVLYRPPIRDICLDALEELYTTYDAKSVAKLLSKWRPEAIATADVNVPATNGVVVQPAIKVE